MANFHGIMSLAPHAQFGTRLLFDIDKGQNTDELTLMRVRAFGELLDSEWISMDQIQFWFSGRGYHVVTPDFFGFEPSADLPALVKATLEYHFPTCDSIYDTARIIRVGNTINKKSGLYKIPLRSHELYQGSVQTIHELAKNPRPEFTFVDPPPLTKRYTDTIIKPAMVATVTQPRTNDDPASKITCMQKLFAADTQTSRHDSILRLASNWRSQGIPLAAILPGLQQRFYTYPPEEVERIARDAYAKSLKYKCSDPIMAQYCDPKCMFFAKKNYNNLEISDSKRLEQKLITFARHDWQHTSFDLNEIWPGAPSYRFYPGEYITVMGDTGLGKTAWTQNIIVPLKRLPSLVLSLEVYDILFYRRCVQIEKDWTKQQVIEYYQKNDNSLSDALSHIRVMTASPNIASIREIIAEVQPRIVIVDVIDGITVSGITSDSERLGAIATQLKQIAQDTGTIIFGVSHISKQAAAEQRLNVHSAKGSSSIEQKSDRVIAIEGNITMNTRIVRSLKTRDDRPFRMAMMMNPNTFKYTLLSS